MLSTFGHPPLRVPVGRILRVEASHREQGRGLLVNESQGSLREQDLQCKIRP